jgi:hypothetical protein
MSQKPGKKRDYAARNSEKLEWVILLAPFAVLVPVMLGAALDAFMLYWDKNAPQGLSGIIFIADLAVGIWQGVLLARAIKAKTAAPPSFGEAVLFLFLRGLFIGGLVGTLNGLILAVSLGWQLVLFSGGIGLAAGAVLGLLAGLPFAGIMSGLEKPPAGFSPDKADGDQKT